MVLAESPIRERLRSAWSDLKLQVRSAGQAKPRGIQVWLCEGFGNQLFQYCLGRILAAELGLRMDCVFRPRNRSHSGASLALKRVFAVETTVPGDRGHGRPLLLEGHRYQPGELAGGRPIVVKGYFQRYEYYRRYAALIRQQWLQTSQVPLVALDPQTVGVHIRLGDFLETRSGGTKALQADYYRRALAALEWQRVLLVSDDGEHPLVRQLASEYGAEVVSQADWAADFRLLMSCRKLVISDSTFSWWAAWLGRADEIVCSGPKLDAHRYGGQWAGQQSIDLYVGDDPRYRFIE